ncbi:MAG: NUDIX domain-containing protein [Tepidibacter sp.]|jgi:ADP-ribose pyrophosphatase YjhB (NUDIX family)|uniref:NUDIX domain-containing protein n=1 Tax=Tepidibacter sp. TaxID=2529387 RepID=UPI0025ED2E66|nr:NUDIX domain-containing protein [Tepidibacter sp.]MCT4508749.1 NUDIX domain-containing protein [Tepidibacter sp.]
MNRKHFTATGIILRNNKILTIWHDKLQVWLPPGGHIEKNETPEEALIRECLEEIDSEIIIINNANYKIETPKVQVLNNPYCTLLEPITDKSGTHYHIDFFYLCKLKNNNLQFNNKNNLRWICFEDLDSLNTFDNVKKLFRTILKSRY